MTALGFGEQLSARNFRRGALAALGNRCSEYLLGSGFWEQLCGAGLGSMSSFG